MSRINDIAYAIANYLKNPIDGIEIGGVSEQLLDIIRIYTKDNEPLRKKVMEWIEYYFADEDENLQKELVECYNKYFYEI